jgi:hypothetical protein
MTPFSIEEQFSTSTHSAAPAGKRWERALNEAARLENAADSILELIRHRAACRQQYNWTVCADKRANGRRVKRATEGDTSMAADKKDYQAVLGALVDYGSLASIINKLNRVLITTEDTNLKTLIEPVVARVDRVFRELPDSKKSIRASLRQQLKVEPYKSVVEYCQKCIGSTKPQWQIIAERHGWGPKTQ